MFKAFTTHLSSLHNKSKNLLKIDSKRRRNRNRNMIEESSGPICFASMEVSSQLKQVFKMMDANGDGKISPLELSQALLWLGHYDKSKAMEEAQGMVREMDCNGDGVIDLEEFLGVVVDDDGNKEDHLRDAFVIFDWDKDGLISAEELRRVLKNLGCTNCGIHDCKRMIRAVDKNGDGFVDFNEFRLMMTL